MGLRTIDVGSVRERFFEFVCQASDVRKSRIEMQKTVLIRIMYPSSKCSRWSRLD